MSSSTSDRGANVGPEGTQRFARHLRKTAEEAGGSWPAKAELADSLRRILDAMPRSSADEATLRSLAGPLQQVAEALAANAPMERDAGSSIAGMAEFPYVSPITGFANPIASPFEFWLDFDAGVARGQGRFRRMHEGGPGIVHGGILAATVDELLGMATSFSGGPGMTGSLTMHYLKPTPIEVPIEIEARLDGTEGRRMLLSAEVHAGGVHTARATSTFVAVGAGMFSKLDAHRQERDSADSSD